MQNQALPFRCPACGTPLALGPQLASELKCAGCAASYPLRDGIVDFLPSAASSRGLAQALMEAAPVARIYESRWWRRNPLFELAARLPFERERELIFAAAGLDGARVALNLACGPGVYARPLARELREGWVIGVDLSWAMLEHAGHRAAQEGLPNLALARADAAALPIQANSLDAAFCCGALHLFADPGRVLAEVGAALRPGRRVVLAVFRREAGRAAAWQSRLFRRLYGVGSFTQAELKSLLEGAGFEDIQTAYARGIWSIVSACKA